MPYATDFGGFGAIGVPHFVSPATGNSPQWPGSTIYLSGPFKKPNSWDFPTVIGLPPTTSDHVDRMQIIMGNGSLRINGIFQPIISTPYTIDVVCASYIPSIVGNQTKAGICLSDGTKYHQFTYGIANDGVAPSPVVSLYRWTNATTFATTAKAANFYAGPLGYLRWTDDGTNRVFYVSGNGKDFSQFFTEATNTTLTPTQVGLTVLSDGTTSTVNNKGVFYHYQISPNIVGDAP